MQNKHELFTLICVEYDMSFFSRESTDVDRVRVKHLIFIFQGLKKCV